MDCTIHGTTKLDTTERLSFSHGFKKKRKTLRGKKKDKSHFISFLITNKPRLTKAKWLSQGHLKEPDQNLIPGYQSPDPVCYHDTALVPSPTSTGPGMQQAHRDNCPPANCYPQPAWPEPCSVHPKNSQSCSQHPGLGRGLPPQSLLSQTAFCDWERRIRGKPQTGASGSSCAS